MARHCQFSIGRTKDEAMAALVAAEEESLMINTILEYLRQWLLVYFQEQLQVTEVEGLLTVF